MPDPATEVPGEILRLIERFDANADTYKSGQYNETQLRVDFLDPLFGALGWDVHNTQGCAEAYRDVIHEDAIRIGGATKAPDYCFRIGGTRKFFLEAKKPAVNIRGDVPPAYQLRRYAWSAKLPLSILSDFEEFAVYDCRVKPAKDDPASTARVFLCEFRDFPRHWPWIASVFSRDAVLKGSFDKYAAENKAKRGTAEVDDDFLATIEAWRAELARNLALRNPNLSQRELNFAVGRIIDRIVFLRICEDRGLEDYGRLLALVNGPRIYARLCDLFHEADTRYNSGLFHFKPEKGRDAPDELTLALDVDDKLLKQILRGLYYPESPYEFGVISADILGQVYEQFLGKVIRLTPGHRAAVEEKPEVRKAGGVYYTPTYIVDYIVRETLGKLLEGKTPKQAENLRVLDPACGSGSFLIGAYQHLLDWHLDWYSKNDPARHAKGKSPALAPAPGGGWALSTPERKRILLAHIHGVDIDPQAVEVTKLSLLLKVLEGETRQNLEPLLNLFHERALPDLAKNIQCGNSLIGSDFFQQPDLPALSDDDRLRINAFDWNAAFPEAFKAGGFDAVIGNPPYGAATTETETKYLRASYRSPANSLDTFLLFMERAQRLLATRGLWGMIVPSGWVSAPSAKPLRQLFLEGFQPLSFVTLPFDVFNAYIDTVIVTARRVPDPTAEPDDAVQLIVFPARFKIGGAADFPQHAKSARFRDWLKSSNLEFLITCSTVETRLIDRIRTQPSTLDAYVRVKRGIEVFHPAPTIAGLVRGKRAFTGVLQRYVLEHGKAGYLSYGPEIEASKPLEYFSQPRILLRQVLSRKLRLQATFADDLFLTNQSVQSLIAPSETDGASILLFLLGILNSHLMSWYFIRVNSVARRDDFPKIIIQQTRELPLPDLNGDGIRNRAKQGAALVENILTLHGRLPEAKTPHERVALEREIAAADAAIDRLVYELYGLTEEEVRVVEGAG